ncbi:MAG: hypothetical protein ABIB71_06215 [Candidatus Woesearchaeota archaeon]
MTFTEDEELDMLLKQENKADSVEALLPQNIKITEKALEKAQRYGPLLKDLSGSANEWFGFLVAEKGDEQYIVRDIILAKGQDVQGGFCNADGEKIAAANVEMRELATKRGKQYYMIGRIHNHADFGTFHSGTDDDTIDTVVESVSLNTEKITYKPFNLIETSVEQVIEGDKVVMKGRGEGDCRLEYKLPKKEELEAMLKQNGINLEEGKASETMLKVLDGILKTSRPDIFEPKTVGFCYSIVVNNAGSTPYAEIGVVEEDVLSKKKKIYDKDKIMVEAMKVKDDIKFTDDELKKEIEDKVRYTKPVVKTIRKRVGGWLGNWYGTGSGYSYNQHLPESPHAQGRVCSSGRKKRKDRKKDQKALKKEFDLQKLTDKFAKEAVSYVSESYNKYDPDIRMLNKMLGQVLYRGIGLKEAGRLVSASKKKKDLEQIVVAKIASNIASEITDEKDIAVTMMKDFLKKPYSFNLNDYSQGFSEDTPEQVGIDFYKEETEKLQKIDPEDLLREKPDDIAGRFADSFLDYQKRYQSQYRKWVNHVVKNVVKNDIRLMEGIKDMQNLDFDHKISGIYSHVPKNAERMFVEKVKEEAADGSFDKDMLSFMEEFAGASYDGKDKIIREDMPKFIKKLEGEEIDKIIDRFTGVKDD